jgi:K+-transporting ATPase ATPase B chain
VLSDWLVVRVTVNPGRDLRRPHDRAWSKGQTQKTPNEIALTILLVALTLVFLLATATLLPFSLFSVDTAGSAAGHDHRARRAAGMPDPDHHRRPACPL